MGATVSICCCEISGVVGATVPLTVDGATVTVGLLPVAAVGANVGDCVAITSPT